MVAHLITRIGIGVSPDSVCAVVARGRELLWSGIDIVDDEGTDAALNRLMQRLPSISWPRPRVHAGVSAEYADIKTVHALPAIQDARALGKIIGASPSRFFIAAPGSVVVTGARVLEPGVARIAVVRNEAIDSIRDACVAQKLTLVRVVPGEIAFSSLSDDELSDPCALALGAAVLDRREPLVIRPTRRMADRPSRVRLAGSVAATSVMMALTIPTLVANRAASAARRELQSLAPARARAIGAERNVSDAASMLRAVSAFESGRISVTWLLGQLVNALPATAVIASLKVDSAVVTLTALTTRAADVVHEIQNMPGASHVEIVGPITYEGVVAGTNVPESAETASGLERVTIRFRLAPDPADLRVSFVSATDGERK